MWILIKFKEQVNTQKLIKYLEKNKFSDFLNAKRKPMKIHEDICIFYKKQPTYNPQKTKDSTNEMERILSKYIKCYKENNEYFSFNIFH